MTALGEGLVHIEHGHGSAYTQPLTVSLGDELLPQVGVTFHKIPSFSILLALNIICGRSRTECKKFFLLLHRVISFIFVLPSSGFLLHIHLFWSLTR